MKQLQIWESDDGVRFDDPEECEEYEQRETQLAIAKRLGISLANDGLQQTRTLRWFLWKVQRAADLGVIYLQSPTATYTMHMRKWLDKDQTDLMTSYQVFLQQQGKVWGRTPNAIHLRIQQAIKGLRDHAVYFKG